MTETHTPLIWLWLLAPLAFPLLARGAQSLRLDPLRLRHCRCPRLSSLRVLPARRMVVHAVSAARLAADDGAGGARAVARGAAHRCRVRRVAAAAVVCVVVAALVAPAAPSRSPCSACARASRSTRASAASSREHLPRDGLRDGRAAQRQHHATTRGARRCAGICSTPASLDRAIASLRRAGYEPYVVLDGGENEQFRAQFGGAESAGASRGWYRWRRSATRASTASDERAAA